MMSHAIKFQLGSTFTIERKSLIMCHNGTTKFSNVKEWFKLFYPQILSQSFFSFHLSWFSASLSLTQTSLPLSPPITSMPFPATNFIHGSIAAWSSCLPHDNRRHVRRSLSRRSEVRRGMDLLPPLLHGGDPVRSPPLARRYVKITSCHG